VPHNSFDNNNHLLYPLSISVKDGQPRSLLTQASSVKSSRLRERELCPVAPFPQAPPPKQRLVRKITFDFPEHLPPEQFEAFRRHIVSVASAAGAEQSVRVVEEHTSEEEDPIPMIQLQAPPKPKCKRQLSSDSNSPPDQLHVPRHQYPPPDQPLHQHPESRETEFHLATSPQSATSSRSGVVSVLSPVGSPVVSVLSRSAPVADVFMSNAMSPKRLKSEHGSIPCTPTKSPLVTPSSHGGVGKIQSETTHQPSPSRPKSGKKNKNSDIVFVFPELHKDELGSEEEEEDENNNYDYDSGRSSEQTVCGKSPRKKRDDETDSMSAKQEICHAQTHASSSQEACHILTQASPSEETCLTQTQHHTRANTSDVRPTARAARGRPTETFTPREQTPRDQKTEGSLLILQKLMSQKKDSMAREPPFPQSRSLPVSEAFTSCSPSSSRNASATVHVLPAGEEVHKDSKLATGDKDKATRVVVQASDHPQQRSEPSKTSASGAPPGHAFTGQHLYMLQRLREMEEKVSAGHPELSELGQTVCQPRSAEDNLSSRIQHPDYPAHDPDSLIQHPDHLAQHSEYLSHHDIRRAAPVEAVGTRGDQRGILGSRSLSMEGQGVEQPESYPPVMPHSASTPNLRQQINIACEEDEEEESRTARLCRSNENPFSFTDREIEKAQRLITRAVPQSRKGNPQIPPQSPKERHIQSLPEDSVPLFSQGRSPRDQEPNECRQSPTVHQSDTPSMWSTSVGPKENLMKSRQLSEPASLNLLERHPDSRQRVTVTSRQYSEPATPRRRDVDERLFYTHDSKHHLQYDIPHTRDTAAWPRHSAAFEPSQTSPNARNIHYSRDSDMRDPRHFSPFGFVSDGKLDSHETDASGLFAMGSETASRREVEIQLGGHARYQDTSSLHRPSHTYYRLSPGREPLSTNHTQSPASRYPHAGHTIPPDIGALRRQLMSAPESRMPDDDGVFEDEFRMPTPYPHRPPSFKTPAVSPHQIRQAWSSGRLGTSEFYTMADGTPKRSALRSQSNVEQSPNQAELDEMAHYKYLRSFSEHMSDPARLMEQLRLKSPNLYARLMEDILSRSTSPQPWSHETHQTEHVLNRPETSPTRARRRLFDPDAEYRPNSPTNDRATDFQRWSHTYPPPFLRRQSFSSNRRLRRTVSWREGGGEGGDTGDRQPGDLDVRIHCTNALAASSATSQDQRQESLCRRIENYIHQILQSHLQVRPALNTQAEVQQWNEQCYEIEKLIQEATELISKLSEHGRSVFDVTTGSVVIRLNCPTLLSVLDLRELLETGVLHGMVEMIFGGAKMRRLTGADRVRFRVTMSETQYKACLEELGAALFTTSSLSQQQKQLTCPRPRLHPKVSPLSKREIRSAENLLLIGTPPRSPLHVIESRSQSAHELMTSSPLSSPSWNSRSPSTPNKRERKFSYGDNSARKAFSELNLSDGETPATSPTKRKSFFASSQKENSGLSPFASSRVFPAARPTEAEDCPFAEDTENIGHGV
ncbi:hypothetical protein BaRGS_00029239, partial [Batillaria attramentaria]